jgi:hypothetical protein
MKHAMGKATLVPQTMMPAESMAPELNEEA